VRAFIDAHQLRKPTLIGHSMGAKTAMTLALQQPELIANLIAVDNAPVDAALKSDFHGYVQGMKEVERAQPTKQTEADELLKPYAKVWKQRDQSGEWPTVRTLTQKNSLWAIVSLL
jgi:pimeloyl-ACP methyl ester carboxylesterase